MNDKKSLRKKMKNLEFEKSNQIIYDTLFSLDLFKDSDTVYIFKSTEKEIDTHIIIEHCFKTGKYVLVPFMNENAELEFYKISEKSKFLKNKFGILEPVIRTNFEIYSKNRIIIVPALAYDKNRNRLGKGLGCYDKYLSKNKFKCIIGLARNGEIVEDIYVNKNDVKVDLIITEEGIIK